MLSGCIGDVKPMPPDEALKAASQDVNRILKDERENAAPVEPEPNQTPPDPRKVSFWFYSHPLMSTTVGMPDAEDRFNRLHPDAVLSRQFIGDWTVAVQKLTVNLAAGDVPDVALVKRSWLARLIPSGRIMPLDALLPPSLIQDIRMPSREALSFQGGLYAMPADGFCNVLFCNATLVRGNPPKTWDELKRLAGELHATGGDTYPIGYLPYLEALWAAGGSVFEGGAARLDTPEAREALDFILSLKSAGLVHPNGLSGEGSGFQLFSTGAVAMTVASSAYLPQTRDLPFKVTVAPIPGKQGPISSLSDNAIVVFRRYAEAKQAAIVQLLDYLTGPDVQGKAALDAGSVPVRTTVSSTITETAGLDEAYRRARGTPLVPAWSEIEFTLERYIGLAYLWREKR